MSKRHRKSPRDGVAMAAAASADLFEALPVASYVLQNDGFAAFNEAAVKLLGHPPEVLRTAKYWEVCDSWAQADVRERGRAWLRGAPMDPHGPCPIVTADGERRWLEAFRRRIEFGGAPAILVTAFDMTERWAWLHGVKRMLGIQGGLPLADVSALAKALASAPADTLPAARTTMRRLPKRQAEVLDLVARGRSNKQIARALGITEGTAKLHVFALMRTFRVPNRTMLALIAHSASADESA